MAMIGYDTQGSFGTGLEETFVIPLPVNCLFVHVQLVQL